MLVAAARVQPPPLPPLVSLALRQVTKGELRELLGHSSAASHSLILRVGGRRYIGWDCNLGGDADLMLDGRLRVGYARVLELRKLNGKMRVPRLSVRGADASRCTAVVLPLVETDGEWAPDRRRAPPVLVPLLSLGRRAVATEEAGGLATGLLAES